jgi:hypothetical protein
MAVTSWTDNDSNGTPMDWDNPDISDWHYVDALAQAANERLMATGKTLLVFPEYVNRFAGMSILNQIHQAVIDLIPYYVNHEDNSGIWNNKVRIPMWSFSSIMDSIGGISHQLDNGISARNEYIRGWASLMYKIINKLRWSKISGFHCNESYTGYVYYPPWVQIFGASYSPPPPAFSINDYLAGGWCFISNNSYLVTESAYYGFYVYVNTKFTVDVDFYIQLPRTDGGILFDSIYYYKIKLYYFIADKKLK